ncbi:hypothetical protein LT85_3727 [Collimonas arenae]|uniref:Uncharacterized protein n=1 Tax=Collimonas arenae TaxID=279058 RepID=A0A0A1FGP4_9BURK|nr:hypothetical protein LT85_3727 [Collimonas arenae]
MLGRLLRGAEGNIRAASGKACQFISGMQIKTQQWMTSMK